MYSFWASPHTCPLPRFSLFGGWTLPCLPLSWSLFSWVSFQPLQECEPCQRGDAQDTQEGTGGRLVHSHSSPELCRRKGHGVCFERRVPILHPALPPPWPCPGDSPRAQRHLEPKGGTAALSLFCRVPWRRKSAAQQRHLVVPIAQPVPRIAPRSGPPWEGRSVFLLCPTWPGNPGIHLAHI